MPAGDDVTRQEIDAKLEAVEARIDAKLVEVLSDIKLVIAQVNRFGDETNGLRSEIRSENRSTRMTMIVTGIVVAIGIVAAMWQMQSGLLSAFQTGLTARIGTTDGPAARPSGN